MCFLLPAYEDKVFTFGQPLAWGELAIMLWLVIMGANEQRLAAAQPRDIYFRMDSVAPNRPARKRSSEGAQASGDKRHFVRGAARTSTPWT